MNIVTLKRGDTAQAFSDTLTMDGSPIDLTGASVVFVWKQGSTVSRKSATISSALEGKVTYQPSYSDVSTSGDYLVEWEVTFAGGTVITIPNNDYVLVRIMDDLR